MNNMTVTGLLLLVLWQGCADADCKPPDTWNEAWHLSGCEETDEGIVCIYNDQTCRYSVIQLKDTCSWVEQRFWC